MWVRISLTAIVLTASVAHANADYFYHFAADGQEFWRPASGAPAGTLLYMDDYRGSVTLSARCFHSVTTFAEKSGRAVADYHTAPTAPPTPDCRADRPVLEALQQALLGATASHPSDSGIVIQGANGSDALALVPLPPDGIEYRRLTVSAFRYGGQLQYLRDPDFKPDFVLYSDHIDGTSGCGAFMASYQKLGPSQYKFRAGSILAGMCPDIDHALWRVAKICTDFTGIRDVEARVNDFFLRDESGNVQIVLSTYDGGAKH